ncbi:hypothetical protein C9890_0518, partial [Perkinsus sp. BL_2016]
TIRYRRSIGPFQAYSIITKLVWWDEKNLYIQQNFLNPKDGFIFEGCPGEIPQIERQKQADGKKGPWKEKGTSPPFTNKRINSRIK